MLSTVNSHYRKEITTIKWDSLEEQYETTIFNNCMLRHI